MVCLGSVVAALAIDMVGLVFLRSAPLYSEARSPPRSYGETVTHRVGLSAIFDC
jgi:hypothetical protein